MRWKENLGESFSDDVEGGTKLEDTMTQSENESESKGSASDASVAERVAARWSAIKSADNRIFANVFSKKVHRGRKGTCDRLSCGRPLTDHYVQVSSSQATGPLCFDCHRIDQHLNPPEAASDSD